MDMITAACAASTTGLITPCFNFCHNWPIGRSGLRGSESFDGYEYILDEGGGEESEVEWRVVSR